MSWQEALNSQVCEKITSTGKMHNCIEEAALLNKSNLSPEAATPGFHLKVYDLEVPNESETGTVVRPYDEKAALQTAIASKGHTQPRGGLRINGEEYQLEKFEPSTHMMILTKSDGGACIAPTETFILFCSWSQSLETGGVKRTHQSPQLCYQQCFNFAQYLRSIGY